MPVYGGDGRPLTTSQIKDQLLEVVKQGATPGVPVGIFTMEHRDKWADAYKRMINGEGCKKYLSSVGMMVLW